MWILLLGQDVAGLRDKPGCPADYYHTCYSLSGLTIAQMSSQKVLGASQNVLRPVDICINVLPERLQFARSYFGSRAA